MKYKAPPFIYGHIYDAVKKAQDTKTAEAVRKEVWEWMDLYDRMGHLNHGTIHYLMDCLRRGERPDKDGG